MREDLSSTVTRRVPHSQQHLLWFRRLALVGALLAAVVVVMGAWVRLTNAGLGCPDWPGCYGHFYPQPGNEFGKAVREMIRKDKAQPVVPVIGLFLVVCLQGALGAFTVTLLLKPLIVTLHLLGGQSILGILWWLSLSPEPRELTARERLLRVFAVCGLGALIVQISLGGWTSTNYAAVACPDFPKCQNAWWPHMEFGDAFTLWRGLGIDYEGGVLSHTARVAVHFTHRLGALTVGALLIAVGIVTWARATGGRLRLAGILLMLALPLQISIGIASVREAMPLPLATLHNAGAVFLVVVMATLLRALWPAPADVRLHGAAALSI